jgi:hypothetical protein
VDKAKGRMKEAAGAFTGDEDLIAQVRAGRADGQRPSPTFQRSQALVHKEDDAVRTACTGG